MHALYNFIMGIMTFIRTWLGLVVPIFMQASDFRTWPRWVRILVRLGVLALVCWLLYMLNTRFDVFGIKDALAAYSPRLTQFYLPVMFLFVYMVSLLLYWLILTLNEDDTIIEYPDIEDAWVRGVQQLDEAGVKLADYPLFLILGRNQAGDEALMKATGLKDMLIAPGKEKSPLRFYVHRDAIYLVCSGATGWGRYCSILAGESTLFNVAESMNKVDMNKTLNPETAAAHMGMDKDLFDELNRLVSLRTERGLTPEEQARLQELSDLSKAPQKVEVKMEPIPKAVQQNDQARLMYLCKLIQRDRRPWCPLNGILVLIPWQSLESENTNKEGLPILQTELGLVRETMNLRMPMISMVCDLETAVGFNEFRNCFQSEHLSQRVGQRIPMIPELPIAEIPRLYDHAALWIGQNVLPRWVMQILKVDSSADMRKTPGVAPPYNAHLYMLVREMYMRSPRLGRLLARCVNLADAGGEDTLPLFGGCYLAATGKADNQTAFVSGVFSRLTENQNYVSWTPQAFADESSYGWWTMVGYGITLVLLAATVGIIVLLMMG